jgi:hypothetical protein
VEKFLANLKKVDCNFDIVFFRDLEDVSASHGSAGSKYPYKFKLTRRILIQHLTRSIVDFKVLEFDSFESQERKTYLASNAIHFMLCDEGSEVDQEQTVRLRHLIWKVVSSGRNVAIINLISWRSSKVSPIDLNLKVVRMLMRPDFHASPEWVEGCAARSPYRRPRM